ncbi:PREDICTED: RNA polymerase I-specific transcription initiation factor RRN3 [Polistes dominula]|uniref:RNA polymerase I-specific transcription initiation factor RRN3 n=1 Tax=Polistes dominula TaxID=743375 RepID=A0ABM1JDU2_POLDO|nr:PREDICTED: RNA polymerase I-specific transcription initiation factor RRN3 [Polistes dominula]
MSIVSSRISSLNSILKSPGARSQLLRQSNKVYFKLPKNVKDILINFENRSNIRDYEDLVCILRSSSVKDIDLEEFVTEVRKCVSLLGPIHQIFVEVLLQINWIDRSPEVKLAYKIFLEDLMCTQTYYIKCIIDTLVALFKPVESDKDKEWEAGEYRKEDIDRLSHVHDVLRKILKVVPMSTKLLLQSVRANFPYIVLGTHIHEVYIYSLLQILNYAPQLQSDILTLITNRLVMLDVNIPQPDVNDEDSAMESDNEMLDIDENTNNENKNIKPLHPLSHTLDVCMGQMIKFIDDTCYVEDKLNMEAFKKLYLDYLKIFEAIILPTYECRYVQFIMLYICSFKATVVEAFLDWLWKKTTNPNIPIILRHTSVSYIASLIAVASFVSSGLVKRTLSKLSKWIHDYINREENSEYADHNPTNHHIFYSVCQALFFIITARCKDFIHTRNDMIYLNELDLPRIISCKLNPLKSCQSEVVHNFADVSRTYQLAYCYTIIESNSRNQLPIIYDNNDSCDYTLDGFFPFSTYNLSRSAQRLTHLLYDNSEYNYNNLANEDKTDIEEFMME